MTRCRFGEGRRAGNCEPSLKVLDRSIGEQTPGFDVIWRYLMN
jgi:hypothetical protein